MRRNTKLEDRLVAKRADFIKLSLKLYKEEFGGLCPYCGHVLQYSTEASCQVNLLILRCAGDDHHDFRRDVDYSKFYTVIDGGKAA